MNLDQHLGAIYHERVVSAKSVHSAADAFCKALADDPAMAEAARGRLADLDQLAERCQGELERRCFVSAQHRKYLRAALAAP